MVEPIQPCFLRLKNIRPRNAAVPKASLRTSQFASFFISLILLFFLSSFGWAAFTSKTKQTLSATAQISAAGSVDFQIKVHSMGACSGNNISGYQTVFSTPGPTDPIITDANVCANKIIWDSRELRITDDTSVTPNLGKTRWLRAKTYLEMNSIITDITGGIQIYTDNKNILNGTLATPYEGNTDASTGPVVNPAGLFSTALIYGKRQGGVLPMAWRITDQSTNTFLNIAQGVTSTMTVDGHSYPSRLWVAGIDQFRYKDGGTVQSVTGHPALGPNFSCFIWMKDLSGQDVNGFAGNLDDYSKLKHPELGIQIAENTFSRAINPDYVFFAAEFSNALGKDIGGANGREYIANVIIEAFTE